MTPVEEAWAKWMGGQTLALHPDIMLGLKGVFMDGYQAGCDVTWEAWREREAAFAESRPKATVNPLPPDQVPF